MKLTLLISYIKIHIKIRSFFKVCFSTDTKRHICKNKHPHKKIEPFDVFVLLV